MICAAFALPEESGGFIRHLRHTTLLRGGPLPVVSGNLPHSEVLVIHTGIGLERASAAMHSLPVERPPTLVVSTGFAGGLDPHLRVGDLIVAENYTDPSVMARHLAILKRHWIGELVTKAHVVENLAERRSLLIGTGASAVDMETSIISAFCRTRGIPMLSLRAISDTAAQSMPMPFSVCFDARKQRPRPWNTVRHLINHPGKIPRFIQFATGISTARRRLGNALAALLEQA